MVKRKILITGASSFLGKRFIKKFVNSKYELFTKRFDLLDFNNLQIIIKELRPHIIFHFAALVNLSRDYETAQKCIDTNIKGTLNLLEALRSFPPQQFIFTSTEEVYGNGPLPFSEDQLLDPPSPYSVTKIASEFLVRQYAKQLGFSLVIFRLATFYGPDNPIHRFIPQIILKALDHKDIPLNSGDKKRDYIYVDDIIAAFSKTLEKKLNNSIETINLGGGVSYSLKEVVDKIKKLTNSHSKLIYNAYPDRILESNEWLLNITKAHRLLNWQPTTSLEEGIKNTITYLKNNSV